jgi:hypothetical protein
LYAVLYGYVGENEKAWPLQSTLANDLRCSLSSLKIALGELVSVGAVTKTLRHREGTQEIIGCWYEIVVKNPKGVASPLTNVSQPADGGLVSPLATELDTLEVDTFNKSRAKKSHDYTPEFEAWWKTYPTITAKAEAFKSWNATLRDRGGTVESIMLATSLFATEMKREGREKRHILHGSTFLGPGERWREYLPLSFSTETLEQAKAWDEYDSGNFPEPDFPRPVDAQGNLLDGQGRPYYIDQMDFKRRYLDDE